MADTKISALSASTTPLAGTEVLPIVQSGVTVKVSVDNLTTGKYIPANGIAFPASAVLSSDANTFDDYEEGTWTPTLTTMGTDFTSVTYDAFRGGKYTKIGNVVHVQCFMRTDAVTVGAASGQVAIGGLPFVAGAGTGGSLNGRAGFPVASPTAWAVNMPSAGLVSSGDARIQLQYRVTSAGAFTALAVTDVGTGANANEVFVTGTYIA